MGMINSFDDRPGFGDLKYAGVNAGVTATPGVNSFKVDAADPTAVGRIELHTVSTTDGIDMQSDLEKLVAGNQLYLRSKGLGVLYDIDAVSDETGYFDLTVTYKSKSTDLTGWATDQICNVVTKGGGSGALVAMTVAQWNPLYLGMNFGGSEVGDSPRYVEAAAGGGAIALPAASAENLTGIPTGSGDVTGPAGGTVADEIATYADTTGKVVKSSGVAVGAIQTAQDAAVAAQATADGKLDEAAHDALPADNPHGVTATQVGLGSADNTADADKPVSTLQAAADVAATAAAVATAAAALSAHDGGNAHIDWEVASQGTIDPTNLTGAPGGVTAFGQWNWEAGTGDPGPNDFRTATATKASVTTIDISWQPQSPNVGSYAREILKTCKKDDILLFQATLTPTDSAMYRVISRVEDSFSETLTVTYLQQSGSTDLSAQVYSLQKWAEPGIGTLNSGSLTELNDALIGANLVEWEKTGTEQVHEDRYTTPTEIDDMADVAVTDPSVTEVLTFNGTVWVNAPPGDGGGGISGPGSPTLVGEIAVYGDTDGDPIGRSDVLIGSGTAAVGTRSLGGKSALVGGNIETGGTIAGHATDGQGSVALGGVRQALGLGSATLTGSGKGAVAHGYVISQLSASADASIEASGVGSFATGYSASSNATNGRIKASHSGAFATGYANVGFIDALAAGSFVGGNSAGGQIQATVSASGAFVHGSATNGGAITGSAPGAFAAGYAELTGSTIVASGNGAMAQGAGIGTFGGNGDILASGAGAFAAGYAEGIASTASVLASASGAFAFGHTGANGTISATAQNAAQFGPGGNAVANSLKVGTNANGIRLRGDNSTASPRIGDIRCDGVHVYAYAGASPSWQQLTT